MTNTTPFEMGRLFFLGAGFSAGAGVPLTNTLLPQAARLFKNEAPGLFSRVNGFATDVDVDLDGSPNAEDFARLCTHLDFMELREHGGGERWSEHGSRERLALKFFLSKAIALATPEAANLPDVYLKFAGDLRENDVVITFNWDTLLETAINFVGAEYSYIQKKRKILIIKLHGSVNWISGKPDAAVRALPTFSYAPIGYKGGLVEDEVYFSTSLQNKIEWQKAKSLISEVKPLIVLPGYGKAIDVRLLSAIWYSPEFLSFLQGGISIIGLSVSQDDYLIDSLFRYLLRSIFPSKTRIRVLNPDFNAAKKFQLISNEIDIEFISEQFQDSNVDMILFRD